MSVQLNDTYHRSPVHKDYKFIRISFYSFHNGALGHKISFFQFPICVTAGLLPKAIHKKGKGISKLDCVEAVWI